ncbi:hypothetical protein C5167_037980 [Papaver somniferum]|uniref:Uncharacterized protein n=1 Tax=Papaver somniferum TaxID=3469 RepID=A0A4Y7IBL3_PAPSO|nr:hypothetical protein C5167_037980 [Papaver somniferum]
MDDGGGMRNKHSKKRGVGESMEASLAGKVTLKMDGGSGGGICNNADLKKKKKKKKRRRRKKKE